MAWQRADDLFVKLHRLSLQAFPRFERYELGGQVRRAAFSVAINIVEGLATEHRRKLLNFLDSKASLAEVGYCIHSARRLGYISEAIANEVDLEIRKVGAPLAGLSIGTVETSRRQRDRRRLGLSPGSPVALISP